jgi:methanol metabolism-related c-type cytochrome
MFVASRRKNRMIPLTAKRVIGVLALAISVGGHAAWAAGPGDPAAAKNENGRYFDQADHPTYNIAQDGTVDWRTYSGFRRYHSDCHVCHGPDGEGSSYAPALKDSVKSMPYTDFIDVVVNGRKNVTTSQENVMPAFANDANVMCYLDDIYVYLRARADEAVPRGRPANHAAKSKAVSEAENSCMGQQK